MKSLLMDFLPDINTKADILMERLRTLADGKTQIDILKDISRFTLDAISSVIIKKC